MTFKEDFKPSKVYNKLVNDVCYNADCYIFRGDVNKLINIISEAKLIKTFDDKDRLIVDKFVLFKNDTDKGIVIANKDLYATEVVDIGED